jgi:putative flippase GtrA
MKRLKKSQKREVRRITEYMISGGAFFWSGYVVLLGLNWWLGEEYLWLSTTASYVVGWVVNYALQRYWVFNNPRLAKHQSEVTTRYIIISAVNLALNYVIIEVWVSFGFPIEVGPFVASGFFTIWNYFWYKLWVFPEQFHKVKPRVGVARIVAHNSHGASGYQKRPHKQAKRRRK